MLDTSSTAATISSQYPNEKINFLDNDPSSYLRYIASVLDAGFQQATRTNPNIDITPPAGSLSFDICAPQEMANEIATKCALYWAATITPSGSPVACAAIVSVSNDAMKIIQPIVSGLLAIGGSRVPIEPYHYRFVDVIYEAVKTIIWSVTEADGSGCNTTIQTKVI